VVNRNIKKLFYYVKFDFTSGLAGGGAYRQQPARVVCGGFLAEVGLKWGGGKINQKSLLDSLPRKREICLAS